MKVLHIYNISGVASTLSEELKRRGVQSDVLVFSKSAFGFPHDFLVTGTSAVKVLKALWKGKNYDLVHWHFPRQRRTINLYSKCKPVLKHYHGTDLRGKRENGFCILAMPELLEYAPKGLYLPHPIKVEEINPVYEAENKKPVICWYRSTITRVDLMEKAMKDLDGRCIFLELTGYEHEEALSIIGKSDVFVDIRTNGWYGLSTAEAMAYGKPIIGYIREDFAEKYKPPVTPYNVKGDLTGTLLSLLSDSKSKRRKGEASRNYAETEHNVKNIVDKLLAIYKKLVEH